MQGQNPGHTQGFWCTVCSAATHSSCKHFISRTPSQVEESIVILIHVEISILLAIMWHFEKEGNASSQNVDFHSSSWT